MLKLPLLLSASPRLVNVPKVYLTQGNWEIESNHVDSEITLNSQSLQNKQIISSVGKSYSVNIEKVGTEKELTIFAKQCQ